MVRVSTGIVLVGLSAYRPAFLHYSCFLADAEYGLGDRGCVTVAGKVEKCDMI